MSLFEIVTQDGLMRPCYNARKVCARSTLWVMTCLLLPEALRTR